MIKVFVPFGAGSHAMSFGNTRLSILDPTSQRDISRMTEQSSRYWIVFNGEIYNFQELRKMIDPENHLFRTSSDTEVILQAFKRWSFKSFDMLRGMFAFAIYDTEKRLLHLGRDQLGIKPLYYYAEHGRIYFASEIRTLLVTGNIPARLSPGAVASFLSRGWIPSPDTMISGVQMLEPGQVLTVDMSGQEMAWKVSSLRSDTAFAILILPS